MTGDSSDDGAAQPTKEQLLELLAHAEANLTHASMRLGRIRSRNRGGPLYRELTSVAFDVQAARQALVVALEAIAFGEGGPRSG